MSKNSKEKYKYIHNKGFTLIELIIVIAIIGIIASLATPRLTGLKNIAENRVCFANCKTLERMYNTFLLGNVHNDNIFNQFLNDNFDEVCPVSGVINYENGKVKCNVHKDVNESDENDPPGDEAPWL